MHKSEEQLIDIQVLGKMNEALQSVLTPEALQFVAKLQLAFNEKRKERLNDRLRIEQKIHNGHLPDFLSETAHVRSSTWTIAPVPKPLQDRRVEITGPSGDRKMVINALNSGAKVFMADLEDANSPTWENTILGQLNLRDAIRREIDFTHENGKQYALKEEVATIIVRPRGWHLEEKHLLINGEPAAASLFDFGLYLFHNAKELLSRGSGPYFYLPKLENHLEARLWNDVFLLAQNELGLPRGTIKATVLIETLLATFEADEILYELREHSAGLNCGRWDYIFSYIKKLRQHAEYLLPDRQQVSMTVPFMRAYTLYIIKTCHRRQAHAIGGMAAQIPIKDNPEANAAAQELVRQDKLREAQDGHDGTWVAHPALVPIAMQVFNELMPTPNQVFKQREDIHVTAEDLLKAPQGAITEDGLRTNIHVAIHYIAAWLNGRGAVPINHMMEDVATAEISRAQVWHWIRHPKGVTQDGQPITLPRVNTMIEEELKQIRSSIDEDSFTAGKFEEATALFKLLIESDEFIDFLTLPGYEILN